MFDRVLNTLLDAEIDFCQLFLIFQSCKPWYKRSCALTRHQDSSSASLYIWSVLSAVVSYLWFVHFFIYSYNIFCKLFIIMLNFNSITIFTRSSSEWLSQNKLIFKSLTITRLTFKQWQSSSLYSILQLSLSLSILQLSLSNILQMEFCSYFWWTDEGIPTICSHSLHEYWVLAQHYLPIRTSFFYKIVLICFVTTNSD